MGLDCGLIRKRDMAILNKSHPSSFQDTTTPSSDSVKAREFVRDSYKKSGGHPTGELKRVYGEYLEYKRAKTGSKED
jgi:hypothetical protein